MDKSELKNWHNIGHHPTPQNILDDFLIFINDLINENRITLKRAEKLHLLDLFAGDCRIGFSVKMLLKEKSIKVFTSFVEVEPHTKINPRISVIKANAFSWVPNTKYNWIVMNPPYLSINSHQAKKHKIEWETIKKFGSNLYALSIFKALEILEPGGVLLAITPFGWVRNEKYKGFRQFLRKNCSKIILRAYDKRNSFKGVNQDIAFQAFIKKEHNKRRLSFYFGYNGFTTSPLDLSEFKSVTSNTLMSQISVFVGPIVWNRNKKNLRMRKAGSVPLIYGGNITKKNHISLGLKRYAKKQYFKKEFLPKEFHIKSPAILIRRTLRGKPGAWIVDSCLVENKFTFTAENHVIVIKLSKNIRNKNRLFSLITNDILDHYKISGNSTISTKIVSQIAHKNLLKVK